MLAVLLLLGGCTRNLSRHPLFSEVVDHKVYLVEEMGLMMEYDKHVSMVAPSVIYSLKTRAENEPNKRYVSAIVASLPAGTPLRITSVKQVRGLKGDAVVAYGEYDLPGQKNAVRWRLTWGYGSLIGRAPWEDPATTPTGRLVW
jgi:hypothetical protein